MKRCLLLIIGLASLCASAELTRLQDGDIVFQTSRSSQSIAVQRATGSKFSHMGIVFIRNGKPYVFEAIAKVQFTPLQAWVQRGVGAHVVAKRLKDASVKIDQSAISRLKTAAHRFEGKPYDLTFEWSDDRIYCSELVWKIYKQALGVELGELQKIRAFNLTDPAVQRKMKERYGSHVPLDEPAISPVAMFNAANLTTVLEQ